MSVNSCVSIPCLYSLSAMEKEVNGFYDGALSPRSHFTRFFVCYAKGACKPEAFFLSCLVYNQQARALSEMVWVVFMFSLFSLETFRDLVICVEAVLGISLPPPPGIPPVVPPLALEVIVMTSLQLHHESSMNYSMKLTLAPSRQRAAVGHTLEEPIGGTDHAPAREVS